MSPARPHLGTEDVRAVVGGSVGRLAVSYCRNPSVGIVVRTATGRPPTRPASRARPLAPIVIQIYLRNTPNGNAVGLCNST